MVTYAIPKGVSKAAAGKAKEYRWPSSVLSGAPPALDPLCCLRCCQSIAKGELCNKPANKRCEKCSKGNRGGCTEVPPEFNARVAHVRALLASYDTAVAALGERVRTAGIRSDPAASEAAMRLARAQRALTSEVTVASRDAGRAGLALRSPAAKPKSTEDFLGLLLAASRDRNKLLTEQNALLRRLVDHFATAASPGSEPSSSAGSEGDGDGDGDDESPVVTPSAGRTRAGRTPAAGPSQPSGDEEMEDQEGDDFQECA